LNDLATSYEVLGNRNEALKFYSKSISVSPHFTDPLLNMSIIMFNSSLVDSSYYYFRRISTDTKSNNYKSLQKLLLPQIIKKILVKYSNDRLMRITIGRFLSSEKWMIKIHNQSVESNNSLEKQLLIEAIYLLEEVDKTISKQEADILRIKYGINSHYYLYIILCIHISKNSTFVLLLIILCYVISQYSKQNQSNNPCTSSNEDAGRKNCNAYSLRFQFC
jgi:hypothetical protein